MDSQNGKKNLWFVESASITYSIAQFAGYAKRMHLVAVAGILLAEHIWPAGGRLHTTAVDSGNRLP